MRLAGEHRFGVPPVVVWAALLDPGVLAGVLPGCRSLEQVEDHTYTGRLALGIGPIEGHFDGRVHLSDLRPPLGFRLHLSGRGPAGRVDGDATVELEADGEGTLLRYRLDASVGGRMAAVGQRLVESAARSLVRGTLERLETTMAAAL